MAQNTQTISLVEGALAAALATMLALIGVYLPPLHMVTMLIWFIPIVIVIVRRDLRTGILALIVATILMAMLITPLRALMLVVQMGLVSLIYGYGFKNDWSTGKIILIGGIAVVFSTLAGIMITVFVMGINLFEWQEMMKQQMDATIEMYRQWGLIEEGVTEAELRESMQSLINFISMLIPGILISGSLLTAVVNFAIVRLILKKIGYSVRAIPAFREWQLPWYFIWGIIAGLGLLLAGDYYNIELLQTIGANILYIYFPILFVIGLSVVTHFYHHWKISKWIKILILIVLVFYLPFGVMLITSLGLFDPVFNYRRVGKKEEK